MKSAGAVVLAGVVGGCVGLGLGYFLASRAKSRKGRCYQIKLVYWDMAGRAEAVRMAFYMGGIPFEDCRVTREEFLAMRERGELPNGQFPIMFVNGKKYAQSIAMLRFAGQLSGLYPVCECEALRCDQVCDTVQDLVIDSVPSFSESDVAKKFAMRQAFVRDSLNPVMKVFNDLLAEAGSGYFCTSGLSVADLVVYRNCVWFTSGVLDGVPPNCIDQFTLVKDLCTRVENHPKIKEYNESRASAQ